MKDEDTIEPEAPLKHEPPNPSYALSMDWVCKNCQRVAVDVDCNITSTVNVYSATMFKVGFVIIGMCTHCGDLFRHPIETEPDDVFI